MPATRHRTPSLTVASSSTWTSAGAGIDKDHDNNDDNVHPHDSASNVSSTTSSARRRKNVLAEKMKLEALEEKHRVEREMEEVEKKNEDLRRQKEDLRRQGEVAKCKYDMKLSEVEAADEEELLFIEAELEGNGGKLGHEKQEIREEKKLEEAHIKSS